jgi:hypothetical protein
MVHIAPHDVHVRLAQEALAIENACNACGLAQRFHHVMIELNRNEQSRGTGWVNQHPIVKLWLDKFLSLARMEQPTALPEYLAVSDLAHGEFASFELSE